MRNHLVTDTDCNTLNLQPPRKLQEMTNNVGFNLVLVTLDRGLQLALSKTIRIGDTKYHI